MRMNGELFYSIGAESKGTVNEAVITPNRISIDWAEGDNVAHLDASSRDGEHFTGHYGYTEANPDLEFDLTLFRNKSEVLLVGTWYERDSGDEGTWFFRLKAEAVQTTKKGRKRAKS